MGSNVNKFFGVAWGFYGVMMLGMTEKFMLQYFTEDAIDFKLFLFFARGLGLMMIALSAAIFLLQFIAIVFGHIIDDALWDAKKNMWYVQMLVNVFFIVIGYLGFKDSQERSPAAARAATATAAAAPASAPADGAGSML